MKNKSHSNTLGVVQVVLKALLDLVIPNQSCQGIMRLGPTTIFVRKCEPL